MKKFLFTMGCAALVLASCTDDALENGGSNPRPDTPEMDANMITLTALDPASQAGRIHMVPQTRGVKSERLNFVASIDNPEVSGDERNWSVTSLLIENNACFVTWHSDRQAEGSPAKVWGGAFDVLDLTDIGDKEVEIDVEHTYVTEAVKFNHVLHSGEYFYLSGGHYDKGAVIARIASGNLAALSENTYASCIGFPGTSVNAVAEDADGLVAVSGFRGGYGYFDGTLLTRIVDTGKVDENGMAINKEEDDYDFYNYDDESANEWIKEVYGYGKDFGGKYVAVDEGNKAYVLRSLGAGGLQIISAKSGDVVVESDATLLSKEKQAEEYDPETGGWEELSPADHPEYLGKHVMVIKEGYAYVGAGLSGLRVYNLTSGREIIWADQTDAPEGETNYGPNTTGLCIDGDFLYAATDMGLRIYKFLEGGELELYAFEVESYGEDGKPTTNDAAKTDTKTRHSCNFVAVQTQGDAKYVYVAYGQSGIRVYKFEPNAEASDGE